MFFNDRETIIRLTPEWKGERLPDGRPMVSSDVLQRMRKITFEEAWAPLWNLGYRNNWECNFKTTSPGTILVGRAVTAVMVPKRPDLDAALMQIGTKEETRFLRERMLAATCPQRSVHAPNGAVR